jgi:hypothetical protein
MFSPRCHGRKMRTTSPMSKQQHTSACIYDQSSSAITKGPVARMRFHGQKTQQLLPRLLIPLQFCILRLILDNNLQGRKHQKLMSPLLVPPDPKAQGSNWIESIVLVCDGDSKLGVTFMNLHCKARMVVCCLFIWAPT